jgi:hypothetical protein
MTTNETTERDYEKTTVDRSVYGNFTISLLREAFNRVAPKNWKDPIACSANGETVNLVCAAIAFFTGSIPRVQVDVRTMTYYIEADGYYAACGS